MGCQAGVSLEGGEGGHLSSRIGVHGVHVKVRWVHLVLLVHPSQPARWEEVDTQHTTYDHAVLSFNTLRSAGDDPFMLHSQHFCNPASLPCCSSHHALPHHMACLA